MARVAHPTDHQPQATQTTGRKETDVSDELFKADVPDPTNPTEETSISINRKQPVLPTIPQTTVDSAESSKEAGRSLGSHQFPAPAPLPSPIDNQSCCKSKL